MSEYVTVNAVTVHCSISGVLPLVNSTSSVLVAGASVGLGVQGSFITRTNPVDGYFSHTLPHTLSEVLIAPKVEVIIESMPEYWSFSASPE